jgi:hypothetical protein
MGTLASFRAHAHASPSGRFFAAVSAVFKHGSSRWRTRPSSTSTLEAAARLHDLAGAQLPVGDASIVQVVEEGAHRPCRIEDDRAGVPLALELRGPIVPDWCSMTSR